MATQMQLARQGIITEAMLQVAAQEQLAPEVIRCSGRNNSCLLQYQPQKSCAARCRSGLGSQGQCQYRYFQRLS